MPLAADRIREHRPGNELHYFPVIGSTMTEAARLATEGAPHGTVVVADEQTAGVGRLGRHWLSSAGDGVYCSILLRIPIAKRELPLATLALGLATAEAIQRSTKLACDLRWPNDVLVNEHKVAGILAQLHDECIIAGIGINVNQESLPGDLRTPATSLRMALREEVAREPLLISLLECVDEFCALLIEQGPTAILRAFANASSYVLHRRVIYDTDLGSRKGVTAGLDNNGFLKVRNDSGLVETLYTGGVRPDIGRPL
ncbi:MAG TPA: biotin--[acetyl-CoA-carboxylase] ligase [Bryobacteraceae bacterium]|nr:biotin--[acetyl-CoA-carboxylase] ligase [Bryobacteraceae bacterium]